MSNYIQLAESLLRFHQLNQFPQKADIILGLGSYDTRVADKSVNLYKSHMAPKIVFSGKSGNWTVGKWSKTEAEIFFDVALEMGVPANHILIEPEATNISENIRYTKVLLEERNVPRSNIIIVTKPNTERRAFVTASAGWPGVHVTVTSPQLNPLQQLAPGKMLDDIINEMVGDLQRLKIYGERGYHSPQSISDEIWDIFDELVALGYDKHLVKE